METVGHVRALRSSRVLLPRAAGARWGEREVVWDVGSGGLIAVGPRGVAAAKGAIEVEDLGNSFVVPGLVDVGFHFLRAAEDEEALEAGTAVAARAGFTTVVDSPAEALPVHAALVRLRRFVKVLRRSHRLRVNVGSLARVDLQRGFDPSKVTELADAGCLGVLVHMNRLLFSAVKASAGIRQQHHQQQSSGRYARMAELLAGLARAKSFLVVELAKVGRPLALASNVNTDLRRRQISQHRHYAGKENVDSHNVEDDEGEDEEIKFALQSRLGGSFDLEFNNSKREGHFRRWSSSSSSSSSGYVGADLDEISQNVQEVRRRYVNETLKEHFQVARKLDRSGGDNLRPTAFRREQTDPFIDSAGPENDRMARYKTPDLVDNKIVVGQPRSSHSCGAVIFRASPSSTCSSSSMKSAKRQRRRTASFNIRSWRLDRDDQCDEERLVRIGENKQKQEEEQVKTPPSDAPSSKGSSSYETDSMVGILNLDLDSDDDRSVASIHVNNDEALAEPTAENADGNDGQLLDEEIVRVSSSASKLSSGSSPLKRRARPIRSAFSSPSRSKKVAGQFPGMAKFGPIRPRNSSFDQTKSAPFRSPVGGIRVVRGGANAQQTSPLRQVSEERHSSSQLPVRGSRGSVAESLSSFGIQDVVSCMQGLPEHERCNLHFVFGALDSQELEQHRESIDGVIKKKDAERHVSYALRRFGPVEETLQDLWKLGIPFEESLLCVSEDIAASLGLGHRKGKLKAGHDADFLVLKEHEGSIKIERTFCNGQEVFNSDDGSSINVEKDVGKFVKKN